MVNRIAFFLFGVIFFVVSAKHEGYNGHSLYKVNVKNSDQASLVKKLGNEFHLDVFMYPVPGRSGEILVSKEQKQEFENILSVAAIEYTVKVESIKKLLDQEDEMLSKFRNERETTLSSARPQPLEIIVTLEEINDYLESLAEKYPNVVTLESAGKSFEGRDMNYLKISTTNFEDRSKPIVFIQALLGANEWLTLPTAMYAIDKLVTNVTESDLVNDIDWIILPVANPDGYVFTYISTGFRFWRKNRATGYMIGNFCRGVDLNRNFDLNWGTASVDQPCDYFFHGREPFSEPETKNIRDLMSKYADRLELFIDIHSFGSKVLYGFGNGQLTSNALILHLNGVNMAQAIDKVKLSWYRNYTVGNIYYTTEPTSGMASDYAQASGVPLSYTYELPSFLDVAGTVIGTLVDPTFIEQAGFETWEGIKVGARSARDNFKARNVTN